MEENNTNRNYGEDNGQTDYNQSDSDAQYSGSSQSDNGYQNGSYQNNAYQNDGYPNQGYTNGGYPGGGYPNVYQPYNNVPPYGNDQLELEEPVKVSEWVLSMVLMMIPCVNIIMMFVWAFSSTEKKSKSNFFKAYLIFFAIMAALGILMWLGILLFVLALS